MNADTAMGQTISDSQPARAGESEGSIRVGAAASPPLPELSHNEIRRYSRHLILDDVGVQGQRKLKATKILCIGSGGLGSPALMYLAAAGILQ